MVADVEVAAGVEGTARPSVRATGRILTGGTVLSATLLAVGFAATLISMEYPAAFLSTAGIVVLLATPPVGLLATFLELRRLQPAAAILALLVLVVLGVALLVALTKV